jgi:hypothetical protein
VFAFALAGQLRAYRRPATVPILGRLRTCRSRSPLVRLTPVECPEKTPTRYSFRYISTTTQQKRQSEVNTNANALKAL